MTVGLNTATRRRIWGGVAVVFLCGVLVGVVAADIYRDQQQQQRWQQGLAALKPRVMRNLTDELKLSPEQQRAVVAIVSQAERQLLELRIAQQPQVDEIMARAAERVKTTLAPDQHRKLDELYRTLQARWAADREYLRALPAAETP
jgi:hypothetical protein